MPDGIDQVALASAIGTALAETLAKSMQSSNLELAKQLKAQDAKTKEGENPPFDPEKVKEALQDRNVLENKVTAYTAQLVLLLTPEFLTIFCRKKKKGLYVSSTAPRVHDLMDHIQTLLDDSTQKDNFKFLGDYLVLLIQRVLNPHKSFYSVDLQKRWTLFWEHVSVPFFEQVRDGETDLPRFKHFIGWQPFELALSAAHMQTNNSNSGNDSKRQKGNGGNRGVYCSDDDPHDSHDNDSSNDKHMNADEGYSSSTDDHSMHFTDTTESDYEHEHTAE